MLEKKLQLSLMKVEGKMLRTNPKLIQKYKYDWLVAELETSIAQYLSSDWQVDIDDSNDFILLPQTLIGDDEITPSETVRKIEQEEHKDANLEESAHLDKLE